MEDLPLGIIAALVPEFAVKDLPLGTTLLLLLLLMLMMMCNICEISEGLL